MGVCLQQRSEQRPSGVRIVVLQPGRAGAAAQLGRLGVEAEVEVVHDVERALARARAGACDLVVAAAKPSAAAERLLEQLRHDGPPVIVVDRALGNEAALGWFRRGAADCVALGSRGSETLAAAALEQIRGWRATSRRSATGRRIQELQRYSEDVIQKMNTAVLVVDPSGCIASCNPPAAQILGQPLQALLGRRVAGWFPDAAGRGTVDRVLAEGVRFKGLESAITRPDGSVVPVGISCAPIASGQAGRPRGAVATFQDLTEMRQLQRQVLQTEKMASIGQLAAGVAHEINNPMGFIHANLFQMNEYVAELRRVWTHVEQLQKCLDPARPEPAALRQAAEQLAALVDEVDVSFVLSDLAKAIRESQEGSERIRHIVQDLRDFSHHDKERVPADLNLCLDSTANIVWPMMKHLVVLEKEYRELPALDCFPMQLKQVFMNLLVNAFQAIEEKLGSSGELGRIRLVTERVGDDVIVSVSDTGTGIAPEHLDRIFDPFFTTKKVGVGTGLGLATCFNIVQRHGGTLRVESVPGEGTTCRVVLPIDGGGGEG